MTPHSDAPAESGHAVSAQATVIIPAHDEAATLGRLLSGIAPMLDRLDVIVVANGCTDGTAGIARSIGRVRVIELKEASKRGALNAGDAAARHPARIYLDADVAIEPATLLQLAAVLQRPDGIVASPVVCIDQRGASVFARAYQRIWALTDYRLHEHTGSGVFGLSAAGRARFDEFPDVIADDLYVRMLFSDDERLVSAGAPFTIFAPRTLRAQIGRLRRTMAGELQLAERFPDLERASGARRRLIGRVVRRPWVWPAFAVYAYAYAAGRAAARAKLSAGETSVWERDFSSR